MAAACARDKEFNGINLSYINVARALGFEPRSSRFGDVYSTVKLNPHRAEGISLDSQEEGETGHTSWSASPELNQVIDSAYALAEINIFYPIKRRGLLPAIPRLSL